MKPHTHRLRRLLPLLILLATSVLIFTQYQQIFDWAKLYNYQPPADVVALADSTTMTSQSRHDFYVNHPQVQTKDSFNQSCPDNGGEQTIILGCYRPPQNGIYIFQVTDPQLKGVEEVTAAHEMLHSAYGRLSSKDKTYVNGLLQDYYNTLTDQRLKDVFAAYQKSEPNDLVDEMHSIFGTEVANLPPALEQYYQRYFTNRQAVVNFAAQYQGAFTSRQNQIASYDSQLKTIKAQIDANQASLDSQSAALTAKRQQFNSLLASGDTKAYNSQVDSFNAQVSAYNALVVKTRSLISQYNSIVAQRNAIAVETQALSQELNSHLQTESGQ